MPLHPMQPIEPDELGTPRFKENRVVRFLIDNAMAHGGTDLNSIWMMLHRKMFSMEDMLQFYQLIGYSVSGFGEIFDKREEDGTPEKGYECACLLVEAADAKAAKLYNAKREFASGSNAESDCA